MFLLWSGPGRGGGGELRDPPERLRLEGEEAAPEAGPRQGGGHATRDQVRWPHWANSISCTLLQSMVKCGYWFTIITIMVSGPVCVIFCASHICICLKKILSREIFSLDWGF